MAAAQLRVRVLIDKLYLTETLQSLIRASVVGCAQTMAVAEAPASSQSPIELGEACADDPHSNRLRSTLARFKHPTSSTGCILFAGRDLQRVIRLSRKFASTEVGVGRSTMTIEAGLFVTQL